MCLNEPSRCFSGYETSKNPGHWQLPFYSALVALPVTAEPTLHITAVSEESHPLSMPLALSPRPEGVVYSADGEIVGGDFVRVTEAEFETLPAD